MGVLSIIVSETLLIGNMRYYLIFSSEIFFYNVLQNFTKLNKTSNHLTYHTFLHFLKIFFFNFFHRYWSIFSDR